MNNKKQIIQIIVIVAAFAGSFYVLYSNGLFGGGTKTTLQSAVANPQTLEQILPYGNSLDFKNAINPSRFDYNQLVLPKVTRPEIGLDNLANLIKPLPAQQTK